jgi:PBSX family phage terminase large subunit
MTATTVNIPKKAFLPVYHHLLNSTADIDFLWGGRDSGKSAHIARQLIMDCLRLPYFRCVLVRKVFNTVKDSQWQLIKDVVEEWGLQDLFSFNISPLEIRCINGNKFLCRGMDDAGRLKSISNPSHAWGEELNQFELDDFVVLMTSLRYNKGKVKVWGSFNPETEGDYEEHWLYKTFFDKGEFNFTSSWTLDIPASPRYPQGRRIEYRYNSTHSTYQDNKFCRPERIIFLEQLAAIDPYYYTVFTLGLWGNRKITDPFCLSFSKEKHVGETKLRQDMEVYLSFDFNKNPITCGVYQHEGNHIWCVESIKLENSDIYKLCDYIKTSYKGCMFIVTGDATGQNTTALVQDDINYYTVIKAQLNLAQPQLKVPSINPKVRENRLLVNAVFHNCVVKLDPARAKGLIFDCGNVSVNDVGDIEKGDRNNPKKRADHLDNWRYYLNSFHKHILKQ